MTHASGQDQGGQDQSGPDQTAQQDPTEQYGQPDTSGEQIEHPGRTGGMEHEPDHGERSYRGSGRLDGKRAIITGGDDESGRDRGRARGR